MNQFTMRSLSSNEGPCLRRIRLAAALPDHDQVNRDQTEPRARAGWARSLMAAAPFCELAKSPHDVGSRVPHDITGPLADARGSVYTCSASAAPFQARLWLHMFLPIQDLRTTTSAGPRSLSLLGSSRDGL